MVNPTFILGPTLTTELRSSLLLTKAMLDGTMSVVRRQRFGVADVRDLADLHIRAMAAPEAPGDDLPPLVIHNDRSREELGWRPRPAETTIVETAKSLHDLGLLEEKP